MFFLSALHKYFCFSSYFNVLTKNLGISAGKDHECFLVSYNKVIDLQISL